jgi:GNAT superfamily N-acetyltransferase
VAGPSGRECRALNREQLVLAAVHDADGAVAGFTEVELWDWTPARSEQADTAVVAAHRGRGLGLWLKAAMLRQLRDERPDVTGLLTGNAAGNSPMLRINERLGYRPDVRLVEWQADVRQLADRIGLADRAVPGQPPHGGEPHHSPGHLISTSSCQRPARRAAHRQERSHGLRTHGLLTREAGGPSLMSSARLRSRLVERQSRRS